MTALTPGAPPDPTTTVRVSGEDGSLNQNNMNCAIINPHDLQNGDILKLCGNAFSDSANEGNNAS